MERGERDVYIREREGTGACPATAGRGGVCRFIPPGIGRGGVSPSGIAAIGLFCGVFEGSYNPHILDGRLSKRNTGQDARVGRTAPIAFEWNNSQSSS